MSVGLRSMTLEYVGASYAYLRHGLAIARRDPLIYVQIVVAYAAPALVAGYLTATAREPNLWQRAAILGLPWLTAVLGTVVVMIAVGYHARGQRVGFGRASREALGWVPRYFWTNCHTSVIFWVPIGLLLEARLWLGVFIPSQDAAKVTLGLLWWLVTGLVAVTLHTRTVVAPFLAVHSDLPGTLAALEAWRLSGRHFPLCLSTFVVASLPVALPLALVGLGLIITLPGADLVAWQAALANLVLAGIQAIRPVLIPALYVLYRDLWGTELARREREGAPGVPGLARAILALTKPLPKLGRWHSEVERS